MLSFATQTLGLLVNTTLGPVDGSTSGSVNVWRGIPFAAPPLGANRFRPPQPHAPWTSPRPAVREGHQCPQAASLKMGGLIGQEDCLYLHVATPEHCTEAAPCAVMFWIYGGSFSYGSDNEYSAVMR